MKKHLIVASSGAVPAIQVLFFILWSTPAGQELQMATNDISIALGYIFQVHFF
jgi:hypothetical protein